MYLVVGLGNPDLKYLTTYHNLGFMAVDRFALDNGLTIDKKECKALVCKTNIGGEKVIIAKPQTYMNLSGESVCEIARFYKIPAENILVVYDDLDLDAGAIRVRKSGSAGTHNGMKSIISCLGTQDFPRVRIGSRQEADSKLDTVSYVLSNLSAQRVEIYKETFGKVSKLIYDFVKGKPFDNIMNEYNRKG